MAQIRMVKPLTHTNKLYFGVCMMFSGGKDKQIAFVYNRSNKRTELIESDREIYDIEMDAKYLAYTEGNRGEKPCVKVQYLGGTAKESEIKQISTPEVLNNIELGSLLFT